MKCSFFFKITHLLFNILFKQVFFIGRCASTNISLICCEDFAMFLHPPMLHLQWIFSLGNKQTDKQTKQNNTELNQESTVSGILSRFKVSPKEAMIQNIGHWHWSGETKSKNIKQSRLQVFLQSFCHIYIYIWQHFFVNTNFIKHNRHFMSTYFLLDPFEFPYYFYCIRGELIYVLSIVVCIPTIFCPTLGHRQWGDLLQKWCNRALLMLFLQSLICLFTDPEEKKYTHIYI